MIRSAAQNDIKSISTIYNHYIQTSIVTFEEEPVSIEEIKTRMNAEPELPWLVAKNEGDIVGFAYASSWKSRCAYRYSVETTIYLSPEATGRGIGKELYVALLDELKEMSLHSIIGGIALPNPASVALHEKLGFEKVAHFKEVGRKFDRWIDVGYWELIF
jgi:L-amino acid N-acyltransferase YncA